MKKWRVMFEIYRGSNREIKSVEVEAGNKRIALSRALAEINKDKSYADIFKKPYAIEEVK